MKTLPRGIGRLRPRQRGLTLVEMTVTILIALFLLAGLFSMVQSTRHTYTNQTQLAQLQDSERMAMTLLTNVIESAGYYPDPTSNTSSVLPGVSGTWDPGQGLLGTSPGGNLDTIAVRFATKGLDTILNCLGGSNKNPIADPPVVYPNTFDLTPPDASGNRSLECTLDDGSAMPPPPVRLVDGVQNMQIYYGVQRDPPANPNDTNVDTYLLGSEMQVMNPNGKNDWNLVTSVRIILTFKNPLLPPSSTAANKTITFERVIAVMGRAGVAT
jgi:type IV pilus assembly protein PilW